MQKEIVIDRLNQRKDLVLKKVLFCTVGGSHQPVITAIETIGPDYIYFFCTTGRYGSDVQIKGQGKVIRANHAEEKCTLPNIPTQMKLPEDSYEMAIVESDNLDKSYRVICQVIDQAMNRFSQDDMWADYTGGTKGMSVALVLAALEKQIQLHLVTGPRTDLVRVADGTQHGMPVSFETIRIRREMAVALSAWSQYGYGQAVSSLRSMEPPRDADLYSAFLQALNLSRAFDSWDRFDHEGAKKILSSYSAIIGKAYSSYFQTVQLLTKEGSGKEPALIYDLWLNALRRAAQGRYDDAVARIYRVIEWTAQWILKDQCGVDSSDLPEDFIPGHIKIIRGHKNKYQAPLYIAWQLVEEKTDTCLASFFRDNGKDLLGKLDIRNASILAHGFVPIDSGKWENFYGWMEQWFWPCFLQDAKKSGLKKMPPQLPDYYSFDI